MDKGDGHVLEKFENAKICADICLHLALNTAKSIALATIDSYETTYWLAVWSVKSELYMDVPFMHVIDKLLEGAELLSKQTTLGGCG